MNKITADILLGLTSLILFTSTKLTSTSLVGSRSIYRSTAGDMYIILSMFRNLIIKLSIVYPQNKADLRKMVTQLRIIAEFIHRQLDHEDFIVGYTTRKKNELYDILTTQAFNDTENDIRRSVESRPLISLESSFVRLLKEMNDIENRQSIPLKAKRFLIDSFAYLLVIACKILSDNNNLNSFLSGVELRYPTFWSTEIPSYYWIFKDRLISLGYNV